jgi:hypothetical protein
MIEMTLLQWCIGPLVCVGLMHFTLFIVDDVIRGYRVALKSAADSARYEEDSIYVTATVCRCQT